MRLREKYYLNDLNPNESSVCLKYNLENRSDWTQCTSHWHLKWKLIAKCINKKNNPSNGKCRKRSLSLQGVWATNGFKLLQIHTNMQSPFQWNKKNALVWFNRNLLILGDHMCSEQFGCVMLMTRLLFFLSVIVVHCFR